MGHLSFVSPCISIQSTDNIKNYILLLFTCQFGFNSGHGFLRSTVMYSYYEHNSYLCLSRPWPISETFFIYIFLPFQHVSVCINDIDFYYSKICQIKINSRQFWAILILENILKCYYDKNSALEANSIWRKVMSNYRLEGEGWTCFSSGMIKRFTRAK